ncbi:MAG TPA: hypothetical protein VGE29_12360 [Prosthecobacter sp.]
MSRRQLPPETLRHHQMDHKPLEGLQNQAFAHSQNRLDTVAEMLALVSILKMQRILTGREVISVAGAVVQHGIGSAEEKLQAAHCLPGQVFFDSCLLENLSDWNISDLRGKGLKELPLASKLRGVAGRTDPVSTLVNQVDSSIEKMAGGQGLKNSLGIVTRQLLNGLLQKSPKHWSEVTSEVARVFGDYRRQEAQACQERLNTLRRDLMLTASTQEKDKLQKKIVIAETYLFVAQYPSVIPEATERHGFNLIARDVIQDYDEQRVP